MTEHVTAGMLRTHKAYKKLASLSYFPVSNVVITEFFITIVITPGCLRHPQVALLSLKTEIYLNYPPVSVFMYKSLPPSASVPAPTAATFALSIMRLLG